MKKLVCGNSSSAEYLPSMGKVEEEKRRKDPRHLDTVKLFKATQIISGKDNVEIQVFLYLHNS